MIAQWLGAGTSKASMLAHTLGASIAWSQWFSWLAQSTLNNPQLRTMCQSSCQQVSGTSLGMMASRALFYTAGAVLVPSRWSGRDGFQMSCASAINHDWPINHQPSTSTRLYSSFWWWHIFLPVTSRILLRSSQPLSLTQNVVGVFWCVSNCCWLIKFKISDVRRRLHTVHWFDSNKKNAVQSSFLLTDALGFPFEIYVLGNTVVPDLLLMS